MVTASFGRENVVRFLNLQYELFITTATDNIDFSFKSALLWICLAWECCRKQILMYTMSLKTMDRLLCHGQRIVSQQWGTINVTTNIRKILKMIGDYWDYLETLRNSWDGCEMDGLWSRRDAFVSDFEAAAVLKEEGKSEFCHH